MTPTPRTEAMMDPTKLALASDEDGEEAFVVVNEDAPTAEVVAELFPAAAKAQWGLEYESYPPASEITRSWFKTHPSDDECMLACSADDPDRSEEWWVLQLAEEAVPDAH
jgi:hypothetical protein